ncbi:hypothetical protein GUITHDRAFT_109904 [Guillardia theta CCMP2712]|uniref:Uncharacterized protein n=1 Tax=Guillardia theta (strain CCMP2712) TaxID=905079 RepID=L1J6H5_GUITC|nr:hypothetical protein GUITHDRAFT_109904 [Guillardia theta CCMP2712]EKX44121.1 hypothetical protein GUITHDRAFT_109904 [Guillardia theta CCMP2712]|eukprot:XP_005831101.1 hypothetical protein GUITHDRAFT_109904 [Guillardia theta CCMP2712]
MDAAFQPSVNSVSDDVDILQQRIQLYLRSDGPYNVQECLEYKRLMLAIIKHRRQGTDPPDRCFLDNLGLIVQEGTSYTLYVQAPIIEKHETKRHLYDDSDTNKRDILLSGMICAKVLQQNKRAFKASSKAVFWAGPCSLVCDKPANDAFVFKGKVSDVCLQDVQIMKVMRFATPPSEIKNKQEVGDVIKDIHVGTVSLATATWHSDGSASLTPGGLGVTHCSTVK